MVMKCSNIAFDVSLKNLFWLFGLCSFTKFPATKLSRHLVLNPSCAIDPNSTQMANITVVLAVVYSWSLLQRGF